MSIIDVLKGEPVSSEPTVKVQIGFGYDLQKLRSSLPGHDNLWFLTLEDNSGYYNTTDYAKVSVLRDIGGVAVIMPDAIANAFSRRHFPVPLDGTSFEALVDQVRQLAHGPAAVRAYARRPILGEPDPNRFNAC